MSEPFSKTKKPYTALVMLTTAKPGSETEREAIGRILITVQIPDNVSGDMVHKYLRYVIVTNIRETLDLEFLGIKEGEFPTMAAFDAESTYVNLIDSGPTERA